MGFYEEFAKRFYRESLKDLERAQKALRDRDYPEAVFHAQQCVEKAVKAMIEAKREYVYNNGPRLASIFARIFENEWSDEYDEVLDILGWFTEYYTRSRYPFLLRGRVVSPDEFIDEGMARDAIAKAIKVIKVAESYLRKKGIV